MTLAVATPVDAFLQRASSLPAMPEVARRLLSSFDRDDLSLPVLADLIARDSALAAKVLRLANSARYSPAHTVSSIGDAAAILGLRSLRDLTLSACLAGTFPAARGFDRLAYWSGNLAVAAYAQPVARLLGLDDDTAYLGGLMLRTGQMLMLMADPDGTAQVAQQASLPDSRIDMELRHFGCSHPLLTAELARHWHFPAGLSHAFAAAADPLACRPFDRLGAALRLASVVADCRAAGVPAPQGLRAAQGALVDHLALDLDWLEAHLPDHRLATACAADLMN